MTQSTIYRQHEARLARSNRLKDDPRPPFVRVLSLLPGLHIFVPRYDPTNNNNNTTTATTSATSLPLGAIFSEETKFIKDDSVAGSIDSTTTAPQHMVFPAVLSTAISSAMAHSVFGKRQPFMLSTNPFQGIPSSPLTVSSSLPFVSTSILGSNGWFFGGSSTMRRTLTTRIPVVMASTSTLFGTRVYLEELEVSEANHFFTAAVAGLSSGIASLSSLLLLSSSSVAGGAAAAARGTASMTTGMVSRYMGSHMVGGMVYFGSYDYLQKVMTSNPVDDTTTSNNTNKSLWNIALAGAVAGSLQAGILTRLPLVCLRAAPTHALIWCAFESATTSTVCPNQGSP